MDEGYTRERFIKLLEELFYASESKADGHINFRDEKNAKEIAEELAIGPGQFSKILSPFYSESYKNAIKRLEQIKDLREKNLKIERLNRKNNQLTVVAFAVGILAAGFLFIWIFGFINKSGNTSDRDQLTEYLATESCLVDAKYMKEILSWNGEGIKSELALRAVLSNLNIKNDTTESGTEDELRRTWSKLEGYIRESRNRLEALNFVTSQGINLADYIRESLSFDTLRKEFDLIRDDIADRDLEPEKLSNSIKNYVGCIQSHNWDNIEIMIENPDSSEWKALIDRTAPCQYRNDKK